MLGVSVGELAGSVPHAVSATAMEECARSRRVRRAGERVSADWAARADRDNLCTPALTSLAATGTASAPGGRP
jgi:hypothetical protein